MYFLGPTVANCSALSSGAAERCDVLRALGTGKASASGAPRAAQGRSWVHSACASYLQKLLSPSGSRVLDRPTASRGRALGSPVVFGVRHATAV